MPSALRDAGALRKTAQEYVRKCFREETQPQVNELAALLSLPPYELSRLFANATGEPLSSYLKRMQIGRARRLLRSTDLPLNQIAYASGFGTRASFFRMFKKICGCTPQEYRTSRRNR